jgi:hypothetical protein
VVEIYVVALSINDIVFMMKHPHHAGAAVLFIVYTEVNEGCRVRMVMV